MTFGLLWRSLCWSFMSGMWVSREVVREDLLDIWIVGPRDLVRIVMLRVWCFRAVDMFFCFLFHCDFVEECFLYDVEGVGAV